MTIILIYIITTFPGLLLAYRERKDFKYYSIKDHLTIIFVVLLPVVNYLISIRYLLELHQDVLE